MTNHTCDKCGRELDAKTVFCPHCGAAVFHGSTGASTKPSAPPPEPAPTEVPQEESPPKFDFKKLIPPVAVVLALLLALALGWDTIADIFSPEKDPQLSTDPSTEQTSPSETYAYDPDAKPTKSTAPSTEPATRPKETKPPEPTLGGTPLSADQLQEYSEKLSFSNNLFFNLATTTVFSHPKEINLYFLFYNGIDGCPRKLSDKEWAHFVAKEETLQYVSVHVLPPDEMNQTLIEHFGITLEETDKRGLDEFAYWEETGNYYWFGTDSNINDLIEVLSGSTLSDGSIQILYRSPIAGHDAEVKNESNLWIMTFTPEGTIFSNLPA